MLGAPRTGSYVGSSARADNETVRRRGGCRICEERHAPRDSGEPCRPRRPRLARRRGAVRGRNRQAADACRTAGPLSRMRGRADLAEALWPNDGSLGVGRAGALTRAEGVRMNVSKSSPKGWAYLKRAFRKK